MVTTKNRLRSLFREEREKWGLNASGASPLVFHFLYGSTSGSAPRKFSHLITLIITASSSYSNSQGVVLKPFSIGIHVI